MQPWRLVRANTDEPRHRATVRKRERTAMTGKGRSRDKMEEGRTVRTGSTRLGTRTDERTAMRENERRVCPPSARRMDAKCVKRGLGLPLVDYLYVSGTSARFSLTCPSVTSRQSALGFQSKLFLPCHQVSVMSKTASDPVPVRLLSMPSTNAPCDSLLVAHGRTIRNHSFSYSKWEFTSWGQT